jgi:hypothetical protein
MNKKFIALIVVVAIVVGSASFFGGMKYGEMKNREVFKDVGDRFADLSPDERQARMQQLGAVGAGGLRERSGGGFISGEILSKDDKSITVKLRDGGSKIVLFSSATQIMKSSSGSADDLKTGESVTATGTSNEDGSISAKSIQLQPNMPNP